MKLLALLPLSIIILETLPASFGVAGHVYLKESNNNLVEMANGDYSINATGSVSEELIQAGFDVLPYNVGLVSRSGPLMISETSDSVYLYTYDRMRSLDYQVASFAFDVAVSPEITLDPLFSDYAVTLVSTSSNHYLSKWKIEGYQPDLSQNHIYYSRELVNKEGEAFPAVMTYQYDASTKNTKCDVRNFIEITNKQVAWQLIPDKVNDFHQLHYAVFNTNIDDDLDYIAEIEVQYTASHFNAPFWSNSLIERDESHKGKSFDPDEITTTNVLTNVKNRYHEGLAINHGNKITERIKPKELTYTNDSGFWFWEQDKTWRFNTLCTLQQIKDMNDEELWMEENDPQAFKWFVLFRDDIFKAGTVTNSQIVQGGIGQPSQVVYGYDDYLYFGLNDFGHYIDSWSGDLHDFKAYRTEENNNWNYCPVDITDFSIMRLWFEQSGEIIEQVVVDDYTDSSGTGNILDPSVPDFLDWWESFLEWLQTISSWFTSNWKWLVAVISIIVVLPLLPWLIKLVCLPFKAVGWLFGSRKK